MNNLIRDAQWTKACAFQSLPQNWLPDFMQAFGVTELFDVNGKGGYKTDFVDQADMCEAVRALYCTRFNCKEKICEKTLIRLISGLSGNGDAFMQSSILAVNPISAAKKEAWSFFFKAKTIQFEGVPVWEMIRKTKDPVTEARDQNGELIK